MNLSLLLIGGNKYLRSKRGREFAGKSSSAFDTIILDAGEGAGIGEIRKINTSISRRPFESSYQTIVILESQNLSLEAQNALLKNLEEPPASVKFILTAPTTESLLSTISSRCQTLELSNPPLEVSDQDRLDFFYNASLFEKYASLEKLDLETWLNAWRNVLLSLYGVNSTHRLNLKQTQPRKILNYVKLINKMRALKRRKASSKLIKAILLLETPTIGKL